MDYVSIIAATLLLCSIGFYFYAKTKAKKKFNIQEDPDNTESDFMDYLIAFLVLAVGLVFAYFFYFEDNVSYW